MNVPLEEVKGDYLVRYDDHTLRVMSTNLYYSELKQFLKRCIKDEEFMVTYYDTLKIKFLKGKAREEKNCKIFVKVI